MNLVLIDQFEGPLDLLLHLIKESNIDIFDINIQEITKQYLDYINKIESLNLNIASEYLVMAAELMEMKSRTLLPKHEEENEEEVEEDPKQELIKRLIEYQNYKEITSQFKELESERQGFYTKKPSLEIEGINKEPKVSDDIDINCLMDALSKFLDRKELDKPLNTKVTNKEYSLDKRVTEIRKILNIKEKVRLEELFDTMSKDYIVITFLSILTMTKDKEIILEQKNNFESIYLSKRK